MIRLFPGPILALVLTAVLTACASGGGGTTGSARSSSDVIGNDELATVSQYDLYTAISRLRPRWLQTGIRGSRPGVVINGIVQSDGIASLRNVQAGDVATVEYMDASDATTRFGTGYTGGAIVVTTGGP